ncbi:hypothetical protein [Paludibacterium sp. B53371]|uniref:hypothetical protein n=1 Tax=Paludibacterium sp. B53371 TaxID=2806263 RepID=UPI001C046FC9|nr:hypothetical protein [Paludibacterium sp. B53371]
MANKQRTIIIGTLIFIGMGYYWFYHSDGYRWQAEPPSRYLPQKNKQEPSYLAYQKATMPDLVPGTRDLGKAQYEGTPQWQSPRDLLGVAVPGGAGRLEIVEYLRFQEPDSERFHQGALVFRFETQGHQPVQVLAIQPLRYDPTLNRVIPQGRPLPVVVSPPGGKVSYEDQTLYGPISLFSFNKTGTTTRGYQRSDTGLVALSLRNQRLLLAQHFISSLMPPDGPCKTGQPSPCRQINTRMQVSATDGDASTAGMPSITLTSTLQSQQGQQQHAVRLIYNPARHRYLSATGADIDQIDALSPARTDAFLAALVP